MFPTILSVRTTLADLAARADASTLAGSDAIRVLEELGTIRRLTDALIAGVAACVAATDAHAVRGARTAGSFTAAVTGMSTREAARAIETIALLEPFAATRAALDEGRLSLRDARAIADAVAKNPAAEPGLLEAATAGQTPLRDACIAALAEIEGPKERAKRQHGNRFLSMWRRRDGMIGGNFALTPEHGGKVFMLLDAETRRHFRAARRAGRYEPFECYAADALTDLILNEDTCADHDDLEADDGNGDHDEDGGADTPTPADKLRQSIADALDNARSRYSRTDGDGSSARPVPSTQSANDAAPDRNETEPDHAEPANAAPSRPNRQQRRTQKRRGRTKTTVHVVIDHAVLTGGDPRNRRCEIAGLGPVDPDWVRSILPNSFLTLVIKHGKDIRTVAHLGRNIPTEVLTALTVNGRECTIAGCHHRGYLERDHSETDYAKGGLTTLSNLEWLCYLHHKRKTQGWQLHPPDPNTGKRTLTPPPPVGARHAA